MATHATCPGCLGRFQITEGRGVMRRHGFSAHFPHGRHGVGWHSSSCLGSGVQPLGTEAGNRFAVRLAKSYRETARDLERKPPHTLEDAARSAVTEARQGMYLRGKPPAQGAYLIPEDFAGTSYRDWFTEASLRRRATQMDRDRELAITNHRDVAARLCAAVSAVRESKPPCSTR